MAIIPAPPEIDLAGPLWKLSVFLVVCVVGVSLILDFGLWLFNRNTMTDSLRADMRLFYYPVLGLIAFFLALWVHLVWKLS